MRLEIQRSVEPPKNVPLVVADFAADDPEEDCWVGEAFRVVTDNPEFRNKLKELQEGGYGHYPRHSTIWQALLLAT